MNPGRASILLGLVLGALGCAHASGEVAAAKPVPQRTEIVTGSRVPQRVDAQGLPERSAWVRTYSAEDLAVSGHANLAPALQALDPADGH